MTKIHRKFDNNRWDYRAISTRVDGKDIIFYTLKSRGTKSKGVEIYSGRNYVVGSSSPSYSRKYSLSNLPKKYKDIVAKLIIQHNKTKWSTKPYVNLN